MNDPRHVLTPELSQQICDLIRAGASPHVAAQVNGIPHKVFERWMRYGHAERPEPHYRDFAEAIDRAHAQPRALAEIRTHQEKPLAWLRYGPGKETSTCPGWSAPAKPARPASRKSEEESDRFQHLITVLLDIMTPYPEVRAAVASALLRDERLHDEAEEALKGEGLDAVPAPTPPEKNNPDPAPTFPSSSEPVPPTPTPTPNAVPPVAAVPDLGFTLPNVKPAAQPVRQAATREVTVNTRSMHGEPTVKVQRTRIEPTGNQQTIAPQRGQQRTDRDKIVGTFVDAPTGQATSNLESSDLQRFRRLLHAMLDGS